MTKKELIDAVAAKTGLSKKDAGGALSALFEEIQGQLSAGGEVVLGDLGKLTVKKREARTGRNPQTGQTMEIAASRTVAFKTGAVLKRAVNQ